jgi:hypothetical protein
MLNETEVDKSLARSPLFKLSSKKRLVKKLEITSRQLKFLSNSNNNYVLCNELIKNQPRIIEKPKPKLKKIQRQIHKMLNVIDLPEYILCPGKGRSHVCNADKHRSSAEVKKLDIQNYFQSTSFGRVYEFFHQRMLCSPDVAWHLSRLCTFKDRLPTGSPSSPILSYFAHMDLWEAISLLTKEFECIFTVYMDDLTISGEKVPGKLIWEIKRTIREYRGLRYHKEKSYSGNKPREVTGVIIKDEKLFLPNRHHLKIYKSKKHLGKATSLEEKVQLQSQLLGCIANAQQIAKSNE